MVRRLSGWGAPRTHEELLKLRIEVSQATIEFSEGAPTIGMRAVLFELK